MEKNISKQIEMNEVAVSKLFGAMDKNAEVLEKLYNVRILQISGGVEIIGSDKSCDDAAKLIELLTRLISQGEEVTRLTIERCADMVTLKRADQVIDIYKNVLLVTARGKKITPKTLGQYDYAKAIIKNTLTFGVGPAGTGKTYLAVACAVQAFKKGAVERIILTRPAIEAGEKLGFLPGDLQQKVDPYLRPLYDALEEMFGIAGYESLIERSIIEIAPLAYMRGRTLNRAFIILDEAQNTTEEQMKMFLTRFGEGSKVVVTGDLTQIDLPSYGKSGLKQAISLLDNIDDIEVCYLSAKDVLRHSLVQKIVDAYELKKQETDSE